MARQVRSIIYPPKPGQPAPEDAAPPDPFPVKLVKYVPAEVIAFFAPAYAVATPKVPADQPITATATGVPAVDHSAQWIVFGVALLGLLLYLFLRGSKDQPPRWYFYVLGAVSFVAWAIGTSTAGSDLFGLGADSILPKLAITCAVFLVPLLDEVLTRLGW